MKGTRLVDMRSAGVGLALACAILGHPEGASGAEPSPANAPTRAAASNPAPPAADPHGVAVLAVGAAAPSAWPLAREVYADDVLRPSLEEAQARILAGEAVPPDAGQNLRDLADTRAAIRGDDAPSRQLLLALTSSLRVKAIVTVEALPDAKPMARVFLASTGAFDAARYAPDDAPTPVWSGAVQSLHRSLFVAPAPSAAIAPVPPPRPVPAAEGSTHTPFYKSPWFWGALGAAAFGAGAVYFATRDNSSPTIHLQVQVPK